MLLQKPISHLKLQAANRPVGYVEDVLGHADRVDASSYWIRPEAWELLKRKYRASAFAPRPAPTFRAVSTFTHAAIIGKYVPLDVVIERVATCEACDQQKFDARGPYCGLCGCSITREAKALSNLAAYEEHLPEWGCKHPQRKAGQGWRR